MIRVDLGNQPRLTEFEPLAARRADAVAAAATRAWREQDEPHVYQLPFDPELTVGQAVVLPPASPDEPPLRGHVRAVEHMVIGAQALTRLEVMPL